MYLGSLARSCSFVRKMLSVRESAEKIEKARQHLCCEIVTFFNEITVTGCDFLVDVTRGWVNHVPCCLCVIVSCVIYFLCFTDFHMILLKYLIYDAINDVKKRFLMH